MKYSLLPLLALLWFFPSLRAQHCGTDGHRLNQLAQFPELAAQETLLRLQVQAWLQRGDLRKIAKSTLDTDTQMLFIPTVVHVIHNYSNDYVSDDQVFGMIERLNSYFNGRNADTSQVLPVHKPFIGNARITFRLATKDPAGLPTRGITRRYSYQALGGDEAAKWDQWPPDAYFNIWTVGYISLQITNGEVYGYATTPASGAINPLGDGLIIKSSTLNAATSPDPTIVEHETGHYLNLQHEFSLPGTGCMDDNIDDTPPSTQGFTAYCYGYDTVCAKGYVRNGVDYPDTANHQHMMASSYCKRMFTRGQCDRMRATLRSTVGNRDSLWTPQNLVRTGILSPRPDLPPVADFSPDRVFVCANELTTVNFTNRSWNDTVIFSDWTISNGANKPAVTTTPAAPNVNNVTFAQPGWVTVSLQAHGVNSGQPVSGMITKSQAVYAADTNAIQPVNYFQEFTPTGDLDRFPIFNYYNTDHKWELLTTTGYYDNTSIRFANFDVRNVANATTQTYSPRGNYADFFTRAFNLTGMAATANLNFMTAGAVRTKDPQAINDTLEVAYTTNCGSSWTLLGRLTGPDVANNGFIWGNFTPGRPDEWRGNAFKLPNTARAAARVYFRFRFKSGADWNPYAYGTGNHFYLDRIQITNNPLAVNREAFASGGMILAPNPTSGSATVILTGSDNSLAYLTVTDLAGRVVYRAETRMTGSTTQLEIPAVHIGVKGLYLVRVQTNGHTVTHKLAVL